MCNSECVSCALCGAGVRFGWVDFHQTRHLADPKHFVQIYLETLAPLRMAVSPDIMTCTAIFGVGIGLRDQTLDPPVFSVLLCGIVFGLEITVRRGHVSAIGLKWFNSCFSGYSSRAKCQVRFLLLPGKLCESRIRQQKKNCFRFFVCVLGDAKSDHIGGSFPL